MDHTPHPEPDCPQDTLDVSVYPVYNKVPLSPTEHTNPSEDEEDTDDATIKHLAEDVVQCHKDGKPMYHTYFYKVVLGGQLETVQQVVQYLEDNAFSAELSWLLGTKKKFHYRKYSMPINGKKNLALFHYLIFGITAIFCVILSPVFYTVHGLLCTFLNRNLRKLSEKLELPLAFAAFSHVPDMVAFFFSKEVDLCNTDKNGNNIFHYIADLSITSAASAVAAFDTILKNVEADEDEDLYKLLYISRNTDGQTAMEYVAQHGAPALLTRFMDADPNFRQTRFSVLKKKVVLKPLKQVPKQTDLMSSVPEDVGEEEKESSHQPASGRAVTREDYFDITMYESKNIAKRSLLLRLIGNRNTTRFTTKDLSMFHKCPVIGKWIQFKVKEMQKNIVYLYLTDVVITSMLVVLLITMQSCMNLHVQLSIRTMQTELGEYFARENNTSSYLTEAALKDVMEREVLSLQLHWMLKDLDKNVSGSFMESVLGSDYNVTHMESLNLQQKKSLVEKALQNQTDSSLALGLQNIPQFVQEFSRRLKQSYPDLIARKITTRSMEELHSILHDTFNEVSIDVNNHTVKLSEMMSYMMWRSLICPATKDLDASSFLDKPVFYHQILKPEDACREVSLYEMAKNSCEHHTTKQVYDRIHSILDDHSKKKGMIMIILYVIMVLSIVYVVVDTVEHLLFFYVTICSDQSIKDMILSVLCTRVPGSYYRKQLNIFTYFILLFHVFSKSETEAMNVEMIELDKITHYLLLGSVIVRFIMHIHCMRLLPWIGHFIITTFMMFTNLIHFSTVLGVVIVTFSVIFHLLIFDTKCPVYQHSDYENVWESVVSVFMLTFGHGDFEQYRSNTPATVSYILFVIIVGLLLMNLIIAIMSATATDLMTAEGQETLQNMVWLNEALSVEFTVITLALTIRAKWLHTDHEKFGYHVQKKGDKTNIFLRVFFCPKLE